MQADSLPVFPSQNKVNSWGTGESDPIGLKLDDDVKRANTRKHFSCIDDGLKANNIVVARRTPF